LLVADGGEAAKLKAYQALKEMVGWLGSA